MDEDTTTSAEPTQRSESETCSTNTEAQFSANLNSSESSSSRSMPRLPETTDVLILGTSVGHAALCYLLAMRKMSVLHVDTRDSYGGHQREELISKLMIMCAKSPSSDVSAADSAAIPFHTRHGAEYKENERVDLCPSLVYADGPLINMLGTCTCAHTRTCSHVDTHSAFSSRLVLVSLPVVVSLIHTHSVLFLFNAMAISSY